MRGKRLALAGAALVPALAVAAVLVIELGSGSHVATVRPTVVARDQAAANEAQITGATPPERQAARASLALVGADASRMRLRFEDCRMRLGRCKKEHLSRTLVVDTAGAVGPRTPRMLAQFLGQLAARDAAERLWQRGEHVAWGVDPIDGGGGVGRARAAVALPQLEASARAIESRARGTGWDVGVRIYSTAGGALVVTVRQDDRTLLAARQTTFITTLYGRNFQPPVYHTLMLFDGPGGVFEGGSGATVGAMFGGSLATAGRAPAAPSWLARGRIELKVRIERGERRLPFALSCGAGGHSTAATCDRLLRERAVLFSPVVADDACLGIPSDQATIEGTVAGIPVERDFSNCYGGAVQAWESLLGVH